MLAQHPLSICSSFFLTLLKFIPFSSYFPPTQLLCSAEAASAFALPVHSDLCCWTVSLNLKEVWWSWHIAMSMGWGYTSARQWRVNSNREHLLCTLLKGELYELVICKILIRPIMATYTLYVSAGLQLRALLVQHHAAWQSDEGCINFVLLSRFYWKGQGLVSDWWHSNIAGRTCVRHEWYQKQDRNGTKNGDKNGTKNEVKNGMENGLGIKKGFVKTWPGQH